MTLNPAPAAINDGMVISVLIGATNTGPATINANGTGISPVVNNNGGALLAGDLVAGNVVQLTRYNGQWRINGASRGRLLNTQVFKSSGTYTPTSGTQYIEAEV